MVGSFVRAIRDLFSPRIFFYVLLTIAGTAVVWLGVSGSIAWFFGHALSDFLRASNWFSPMQGDLPGILGFSVSAMLTLVGVYFVLLPVMYWTSLVFVSLTSLPLIMKVLSTQYARVEQKSLQTGLVSYWQISARIFVKAMPIYALLVALAWVPGVFLLGNFTLGAWVNSKFLSAEILCSLGFTEQFKSLCESHRRRVFSMGMLLMFMLAIPVVQWAAPVFGGLWFCHYWLKVIERGPR